MSHPLKMILRRILCGEDFLFLLNSLRSYLLSLFLQFGLIILFFSLFLSWFDYLIETFEICFGSIFERLIRLLVFYLEYGSIFRKVQTFCLPNVSIGKIAKLSLKLILCIHRYESMYP